MRAGGRAGLKWYLVAGIALATIRSRQLYKQCGYENFEAYLSARWGGFSRAQTTQLMAAVKILRNCYIHGRFPFLPVNAGMLRELGRLETPADQIEVWGRVISATAPEDITAEVVFNHLLAMLNDRAEQTAETQDPDDAAFGDPVSGLPQNQSDHRGLTAAITKND